jgi:hypothetical protein
MVIDYAPDGGIPVLSTVKDLTVGSTIGHEPMGTLELKGAPGEWDLHTVW